MGVVFDHQAADAYDAWLQSRQGRAIERELDRQIRRLLTPRSRERVLDIGCGSGNHLLMLNRMGLDITGVDASPQMVARARTRFGGRPVVKRGRAEDLPYEDNEFDLSVMINTLEFLDNPLVALREAARVTNRKIFIGVFNSLSCDGVLQKIQGYFGRSLFARARFFHFWELKSLLHRVLGEVPLSWFSIGVGPGFMQGMRSFGGKERWGCSQSRFGFFLGVSAAMAYRVKTENLSLKVELRKSTAPLVGTETLGNLRDGQGE